MIIEQSRRKYSLFKLIQYCCNSGPTVEPCAAPIPVNLPQHPRHHLYPFPDSQDYKEHIHIFALLPKETLPQLFKQFIQIVKVLYITFLTDPVQYFLYPYIYCLELRDVQERTAKCFNFA
jgi:hypothetical protein